MSKKNTLKQLAVFTLIAGVAGYLAGLLTAPQSGVKTRKALKQKGSAEIESAEERLKMLYAELSELIVAANGEDKGLDKRQLKRFKDALTAAKRSKTKLAKVVDALKDGGSDDQDLNKAVQEAERAIKHAKTFLLKK